MTDFLAEHEPTALVRTLRCLRGKAGVGAS